MLLNTEAYVNYAIYKLQDCLEWLCECSELMPLRTVLYHIYFVTYILGLWATRIPADGWTSEPESVINRVGRLLAKRSVSLLRDCRG